MADDKKPKQGKATNEDLIKAIRALKSEMPRPSFSGEPGEAAASLNQASRDPRQSIFEAGPRGKDEVGFNPSLPPEARYPLTEQAADLPAYSYRLKDGPAAETGRHGRYTGPMAQDMARLPALHDTVQRGGDGFLRVDTPQLTLANTSMISELARRQKEQEQMMQRSEGQPHQDLIAAIRALKGEMPRPEERPFDQASGEIVRENPYTTDGEVKRRMSGNALSKREEDRLKLLSDVGAKRSIY